ncbi:MAG: IS630 family transposase [SAR324 cluster bacterium]|nr:IS630 family transposase [SAR324 cluster bacterium]
MDPFSHQFSSSEIEKLKTYRDAQKDSRLKQRFTALLMLARGIAVELILEIVGIGQRCLLNWLKKYLQNGINSLNSFNYKPKVSYLTEDQIKELLSWVRTNKPFNIKVIVEHIDDHYNITYNQDAVRKLLKRHGLKWMRPKLVPSDPPSIEEQTEFIRRFHQLQGFHDMGVVQLFGDAMHLIHQVYSAYCWGDPTNPPVFPTNSGRQRLNILGAYETSETPRFIHYTNEENCDADAAILYLDRVLKAYPDKHSIVLYLDNASYFRAKKTQEWLGKHPKLIVQFLPPYSPNLNLIERFWRFTKRKLIHNQYYALYKTFRSHTFRLLNNISPYINELKSLINGKFEIIFNNHAV